VDFWRKPPPLIGFGVERHTLAHRRDHPGISPYFSGVSIAECAAQPVRAQVSLRVWRTARDPYPDCNFLPTHRALLLSHLSSDSDDGILKIDSFSHLGCNSSGQTFGVACRVSEQIRTNPSNPFPYLARQSF
jgi:hypothetical protein